MTPYAIDPEHERILELAAVPHAMEAMGFRRPHLNVVRRWTKKGVRGIKLPTVLVGPRRYTSREAMKWWIAATSAASRAGIASTPAADDVRYPMTATERRILGAAGLLEGTC